MWAKRWWRITRTRNKNKKMGEIKKKRNETSERKNCRIIWNSLGWDSTMIWCGKKIKRGVSEAIQFLSGHENKSTASRACQLWEGRGGRGREGEPARSSIMTARCVNKRQTTTVTLRSQLHQLSLSRMAGRVCALCRISAPLYQIEWWSRDDLSQNTPWKRPKMPSKSNSRAEIKRERERNKSRQRKREKNIPKANKIIWNLKEVNT